VSRKTAVTMHVYIYNLVFSFHVDLIPIFDGNSHFVVLTWTNNAGVFELIIDGILQSSLTGIETDGTIAAQRRFIVGGSDFGYKNFVGFLHDVNVWDKVGFVWSISFHCITPISFPEPAILRKEREALG
jgi:hypothetical protein